MARPLIALIEPDPTIRDLIVAFLTDEGYRVVTSEDAAALVVIRRHRPGLVVLDEWLGRPDGGWLLLWRLRGDPATAGIPAIVTSTDPAAFADRGRLRELRAAGLVKPFDLDDLLGLVREALARSPTATRRLPAADAAGRIGEGSCSTPMPRPSSTGW